MRAANPLVVALAIAALHHVGASAQAPPTTNLVPSIPCARVEKIPLHESFQPGTRQHWAAVYETGDWDTLQGVMTKALEKFLQPATLSKDTYYSVVFVANNRQGDPTEYRVLLHDPQPGPYSLTLPGVTSFTQVFVTDTQVFVPTLCISQKIPHDVGASIGAALIKPPSPGKANPAAANALVDAFKKSALIAPPQETLYAYVTDFTLPTNRALITLTDPGAPTKCTAQACPPKFVTIYNDRPDDHWAFGAITGAILNTSGPERVSIMGGKLNPNPLSGVVTAAIAEWHPLAFDPQNEKHDPRLFGGVALTPEIGVTAGAGIGLIGGLSLDLGYGFFRVDTARPGEQFGSAFGLGAPPGSTPLDARHPLRKGLGQAIYLGLGFAASP